MLDTGVDFGLEYGSLFAHGDWEGRGLASHHLRVLRRISNDVLSSISSRFDHAYASIGRSPIALEKLLRALLLQALYMFCSEWQLEGGSILIFWFVGLGIDDAVSDAPTFAKKRDQFLQIDAAAEPLAGVSNHPDVRRQISREQFSVDGTLIDAWASMKSFKTKGDAGDDAGSEHNAERDFRGEKRSNKTYASTTDPYTELYKKAGG